MPGKSLTRRKGERRKADLRRRGPAENADSTTVQSTGEDDQSADHVTGEKYLANHTVIIMSYLIACVADLVISLQIWFTSSRRCSSPCHATEGSESLFKLCGTCHGPINTREKLFII